MKEYPFALEWCNVINRTTKSGHLRHMPSHDWRDDEDDARKTFDELKASSSVLWVRLYQRREGELRVIEQEGQLPEGENNVGNH